VSKEEITATFYSPWDCIKPVSSIKYLGILVGYEITPADVFAEAIEKLENRVAEYMPLKDMYNTQNRVIICNSFLTPILSFTQRFFFMGSALFSRVRRILSPWLVPARLYKYSMSI
jgi:hypothetical protein